MATETIHEDQKNMKQINITKENVLEATHTTKTTVTEVIRVCKQKFAENINNLETELKKTETELVEKKVVHEAESHKFDAVIAGMNTEIQKHRKNLQTDQTTQEHDNNKQTLEKFVNTNKKHDADITELKKKLTDTQQQEKSGESLSSKNTTRIQDSKNQIVKLTSDLSNIEKELQDLDGRETASKENISYLLSISEEKTGLITRAVDEEFISYTTSFQVPKEMLKPNNTQKARTNAASIQVPKEMLEPNNTQKARTIWPECDFDFDVYNYVEGHSWNTKQKHEYETKLKEYVKNKNLSNKIHKDQEKRIRENVESSVKQGKPLKKKSTAESWCDVSSSQADTSEFSNDEPDISKYSIDQLAAHVQNLTAELRGLS